MDLKFIRQNPEIFTQAIEQKRVNLDLSKLLELDRAVLDLKRQMQVLEEERNANAKKMPKALPDERAGLITRGKAISGEMDPLKPKITLSEEELQKLLWLVPTIPSSDAPLGRSEDDNVEIKKWGSIPEFDFKPLDHVQILEKNDWAELERIAQVAGSRSYSLKNDLVLLEMALIRFTMDRLKGKGFTLITVPSLAREAAFFGTGHFPTGKDQAYSLPEDQLYLAGTAEVLLNGLHTGETLEELKLPILYAGFSPCFRREAGSAGRDVRGLVRVHQFFKVEQYILCKNDPAESEKWHCFLLQTSEEIVQALELPYRVVDVCTGDMGPGKYRQYDIESWVPSEQKYRETHSCSNLHDWQARRAQLRYRAQDGAMKFCHTLNNTAIATPRILVPFLENHQQADGSIKLPEAIQPYMGGMKSMRGTLEGASPGSKK